jgi:hypothetical protein
MSRRQEHHIQPITPLAVLVTALVRIQLLCAKGSSLEDIWTECERAISAVKTRH